VLGAKSRYKHYLFRPFNEKLNARINSGGEIGTGFDDLNGI